MNTTWIKPKPHKSLRHALRTGAIRAALITGLFSIGFVANGAGGTHVVFPEAGPAAAAEAPAFVADAERLAKAHGCWTGEAPADMVGVIPGHAIVIKNDQAVYGGQVIVGQALDAAFGEGAPGVTPYAFCR